VVGELQAGHALGDHGPDPRVGAEGRDGLLTAMPAASLVPHSRALRIAMNVSPRARFSAIDATSAMRAMLKGSETYVAAARLGMHVRAGHGFFTDSVMSFPPPRVNRGHDLRRVQPIQHNGIVRAAWACGATEAAVRRGRLRFFCPERARVSRPGAGSSRRCMNASMRFRKSWPSAVSRSNWYSCPAAAGVGKKEEGVRLDAPAHAGRRRPLAR